MIIVGEIGGTGVQTKDAEVEFFGGDSGNYLLKE